MDVKSQYVITVVICTYNRCRLLARALDSVAGSRLVGSQRWEVLVIDNNSRDDTKAVIEDFSRRYPGRFRYHFELKPGKSNALNTGLRESHGSVLAFMDDDVTVDEHWLQNLTAPLRQGECAGVGGRVLPDRDFIVPEWLSETERYALAPLAVFDLGSDKQALDEAPVGTNMAFRKEMFERYGNFRIDLGPQPGSEIRGEDSEFANRLLKAGERLCYEPSAIVYHSVPETRLDKGYFLKWWFDKGRSAVRESCALNDVTLLVAGVPLIWCRRLITWTLRWCIALRGSRRFSARLRIWYLAGQITEARRQRMKSRQQPVIASLPDQHEGTVAAGSHAGENRL